MKRFICLFTLVIAMVFIVVCHAEKNIDFSSMSDDELVSIRDSVNLEMHKRGVECRIELYEGVYRIGEDIDEGNYIFTVENDKQNSNKRSTAAIAIYDTYDSMFINKNDLTNRPNEVVADTNGKKSHIYLVDGMGIKIAGFNVDHYYLICIK